MIAPAVPACTSGLPTTLISVGVNEDNIEDVHLTRRTAAGE